MNSLSCLLQRVLVTTVIQSETYYAVKINSVYFR